VGVLETLLCGVPGHCCNPLVQRMQDRMTIACSVMAARIDDISCPVNQEEGAPRMLQNPFRQQRVAVDQRVRKRYP
jgi:hypothetical protein